MIPLSHVARAMLAVTCCSGCSFLFVNTAPANVQEGTSYARQVECTSGKAGPAMDAVFTALEVARIAVAAGADDSVYQQSPISRTTDISLGVGFAGLFLASAIYGFHHTGRCQRLHAAGPMPGTEDVPESVPAAPASDLAPASSRSVPDASLYP